VLLGLIAQQVTHQSLSQLYQNHFFIPFKLNKTYYFAEHFPKDLQSKFWPGFYKKYPATPNNMTWLQGAGGIISNLKDLTLWGQALYQSPALANNFTQITAGMVSTTNGALEAQYTSGMTYNAGVFRTNTPYGMMWYTPGLDSGYRNMLAFFPCQGLIIAYTMNNGGTRYSTHQVLLNLLLTNLMADFSVKKVLGAYQNKVQLPQYCSLPPSKGFNLPLL